MCLFLDDVKPTYSLFTITYYFIYPLSLLRRLLPPWGALFNKIALLSCPSGKCHKVTKGVICALNKHEILRRFAPQNDIDAQN